MSDDATRAIQKSARRIVVKVGSSTLTREGKMRPRKFSQLATAVAGLMQAHKQVVIVSSGAIALGSNRLGWSRPGRSIRQKQAAAAVGQVGLVDLYRRRFARRGRRVAQVLLTRAGLESRERFLNARHTLLELLRLGAVPIVNENDTVATEEIRCGDNDNPPASIVNLIGANLLVILTDVDGLCERPPSRSEPRPPLIDVVEKIGPEIKAFAAGSNANFGRGGMITKLEAAHSAARSGAATVICNGRRSDALVRIAAGESVGTLFLPGSRLAGRKHWLAFTTRTRGALSIDAGAARALRDGRSLLPAGVMDVQGDFRTGDPVGCLDGRGREIARGLVAYPAAEPSRTRGLRTREITPVLGYSKGDEVIHRDDLVLLGN